MVNEIFAELEDLIENKTLTEWQRSWLEEIIEYKDRGWTEDYDILKAYYKDRKCCIERMTDIDFLKEKLLPNLRKEKVHDDDVERFVLKLKEHGTSFAQGEYAGGSFSHPVLFFSKNNSK